jgi:branched-chain amino acid transport system substrate-binding protein
VPLAPIRTLTRCALALTALALGGCLGGEERSTRVEGGTLTIYSSLPRSGVSALAARAVAAGQRLALGDAGGRVGGLRVRLVELDSAARGERLWSPELVSANAERAADDATTIAYLGELDYGASAVSVPITNDAGVLQVSPVDGLTSLTQSPLGRPRAGPERYYPSGRRSFVRLVPTDELEAETLLAELRAAGAERMAVLFDSDIYSRELGGELLALGRRDGPEPVATAEYRGRVDEIPDAVRQLAEQTPDAVVYAAIAGPGTGRVLAQIRTAMPGTPVYATAGLLARDARAPVPVAPDTVVVVSAVPAAGALPRGGRRVLARLRRRRGETPARPEAVFGYESMRLVLDAIRAGGADRERVRRAGLRIRDRESPLGSYAVRATGDVGVERFALYRLREGRFEYARMVR